MMWFFWNDAVRKPEGMECLPKNVNSVELKFIHSLIKILTTTAKRSTGFVIETIVFSQITMTQNWTLLATKI